MHPPPARVIHLWHDPSTKRGTMNTAQASNLPNATIARTTYTLTVTELKATVDLAGSGRYSCSRTAYEALLKVPVSALLKVPVSALLGRWADIYDGERDKAAELRKFRALPRAVRAVMVADCGGCTGALVDSEFPDEVFASHDDLWTARDRLRRHELGVGIARGEAKARRLERTAELARIQADAEREACTHVDTARTVAVGSLFCSCGALLETVIVTGGPLEARS